MKKIALSVAFILFLAGQSIAQKELRFGFQSSPMYSWMTTDQRSINSSGHNFGLKLGMISEYYFRPNYAFSSGIGFWFESGGTLLHEYSGIYWDPNIMPPGVDTLPAMVKLDYGIQYVEIPVGIKMRTREFGYNRYFIEPAITFGFKTQARGTATGTGLGDTAEKINIRDMVNPINLFWGVSAGLERSISPNTALLIGAGFQIGFIDATKNRGTVVFNPQRPEPLLENSKGKINGVTLRLGILF